jgi:hypothetical protein
MCSAVAPRPGIRYLSHVTSTVSVEDLRRIMPGSWRIHATTFPMWLNGKRLNPTITYTPLPGDGVVLRDEVGYRTRSGTTRRIRGIDRYQGQGFVWRGSGPRWILTSRWRVEQVSTNGDVIVITFDKSLVTPTGMDVLGRGDDDRPELRENLAAEAIDLDAGRLARLTWL